MGAFKILEQNALNFKLAPISIRELFHLNITPCDLYGLDGHGLYKLLLRESSSVQKDVLIELINKRHYQLFVSYEDRIKIKEEQQNNLRICTRSLSVGDALEKCKKLLTLLSINMGYLYENPTDNETLKLQYQSALNLSSFLQKNLKYHNSLYKDFTKQRHHYIFAQPLLSSMFLLGALKHVSFYTEKEIDALFVTSYFKDIGMSAIPAEKYELENLSDDDKNLLIAHPTLSVKLLEGRIPLSADKLKIIENHHAFSMLSEHGTRKMATNPQVLTGFETMMVIIMDIISAMIAQRPYREATKLFDALDLVRILVADQYPHEFKLIVNYFKKFFDRR